MLNSLVLGDFDFHHENNFYTIVSHFSPILQPECGLLVGLGHHFWVLGVRSSLPPTHTSISPLGGPAASWSSPKVKGNSPASRTGQHPASYRRPRREHSTDRVARTPFRAIREIPARRGVRDLPVERRFHMLFMASPPRWALRMQKQSPR